MLAGLAVDLEVESHDVVVPCEGGLLLADILFGPFEIELENNQPVVSCPGVWPSVGDRRLLFLFHMFVFVDILKHSASIVLAAVPQLHQPLHCVESGVLGIIEEWFFV